MNKIELGDAISEAILAAFNCGVDSLNEMGYKSPYETEEYLKLRELIGAEK